MFTKKIVLAAIAGTALFAASAAQADHNRGPGYRHQGPYGHHYRHVPYRVVVRPAPVYYVPAPVYYPPQPVYYAPPAPVYYAPPRPAIFGTLPVGDARVRIGVQF